MVRILLAEDEEILRMLIVDTLEDEGYEIVEAADGEEAISYLNKEQFDLLIVDYMMPGKTGLEVIKEVKSNPTLTSMKILMLSAKSQQEDQQKVLAVGADMFLSKPFSPMYLIELLEELLG
ncbi:response regulator [Mangrovibacillus cuniculi]|uniref:Response regulator n=1 Tax=Mangrovibacillus cuniculi TaxID=2593652 RepID=A0A7S8CAL5_9BACI|nr:response regulator [Mangrovibacillus cuniculi]QPC46471.1 response regulator [Mangrovibacillus cuniculi]